MTILDAIKSRRSIRKFEQTDISRKDIEEMLEAARLAPSAANLQPVSYIAVRNAEVCEKIFLCTKWAAYLKCGTPAEDERPMAYIAVLADDVRSKYAQTDAALAIENIVLTAWAKGIGSCILGAIDRVALDNILNIKVGRIHSIIALGYPAQKSAAEDMKDDNIKYYMNEKGEMRVPKRALQDIGTWIE